MTEAEERFAKLCDDTAPHGFDWGCYGGDEDLYVALKKFLEAMPSDTDDPTTYDYKRLMEAVGGSTAWLLIYRFIECDLIEYGTSPRYGWLTEKGQWLRKFVVKRTPERLMEIHDELDGRE